MDAKLSADVLDVDLWREPEAESSKAASSRALAVAALVSGKVVLLDYSSLADGAGDDFSQEEDDSDGEGSSATGTDDGRHFKRAWSIKPGGKSCRAARFSTDGRYVLAISKDKSISRIDTETGQVSERWKSAHDAAPSSVLPISERLFASGDDEGVVKFWDPRERSRADGADEGTSRSAQTYSHHTDWVTDMVWADHIKAPPTKKSDRQSKNAKAVSMSATSRSRLICVAGDGLLSIIDPVAGKKGVEISEDQEDELLSIRSIKGGDKFVVGTALGPLSIWAPSKGMLDHVDRLAGHPASIDSIDVLDQDTILTGSSDGLVRIVQVYPHKLLGVAADHGGFPVERAVHAGDWLASVGHESFVRFTNLRSLLGDDYDEDDGDEDDEDEGGDSSDEDVDSTTQVPGTAQPGPVKTSQRSDSDSDSSVEAAPKKRQKKAKSIASDLQQASTETKSTNFFAEL